MEVIQRKDLIDEIAHIESGEICRRLSVLSPILVNGVLRVGGHLEHYKLPSGARHQIIQSKNSPITRMLIRALYQEHFHIGPTGLIHAKRRDYWLRNAASIVEAVTRSCVKCSRVQPSVTGVGYASPFKIEQDPNGPEVVTPAHYLIGRPLTAIPESSYEDVQANRLDKWQHLQNLSKHLWKAWQRDNLSSLKPRKKNRKQTDNVVPGMIVLVLNRNLPPLQWKFRMITKTYPGVDGLVRAVDVYSDKSTFRRPINKLSILPIEDNKANQESPKVLK